MTRAKGIFIEVAFVLVVGSALALAANHFSPRGLGLRQDYFPGSATTTTTLTVPTSKTNTAAVITATPDNQVITRLKEKGLNVVDRDQVSALLRDARFEQNVIVIIDARSADHYEAGHIPGAYEFDHYHPEKYATTIVPVCEAAQQIVVYCGGGDCEDSEFAALMLRDVFGVPGQKLFVYPGGIKDWEKSKQPVETGPRNSGQKK
jgi:rhodanese-related sulfurtransferase